MAQRWGRWIAAFAGGGVLLAALTLSAGQGDRLLAVVAGQPVAAIGCVACSIAFVLCRGIALSAAARAVGLGLTAGGGCRLFCEGVALELFTWPGKLWADAYRGAALGEGAVGQRVGALLAFRLGSLAGAGAVIASVWACVWARAWASDSSASFNGLAAAGVGAVLVIAALRGLRKRPPRSPRLSPDLSDAPAQRRPSARAFATLIALGALACAADLVAITGLAYAAAGADPLTLAKWHLLAGLAGAASGLPLGVGVMDTGCWLGLTRGCGVDPVTAAGIVLLYRSTGPTLTLILGALSLACRARPVLPAGIDAPAESPLPLTPSVTPEPVPQAA
jgi:hypothetical protein